MIFECVFLTKNQIVRTPSKICDVGIKNVQCYNIHKNWHGGIL